MKRNIEEIINQVRINVGEGWDDNKDCWGDAKFMIGYAIRDLKELYAIMEAMKHGR